MQVYTTSKSAAPLEIGVVEIGDHAQPDLVAERHAAVRIEQIERIVLDQIADAVVPLLLPGGILAIPALVVGGGAGVIEIGVFRIGSVVGNAGLRALFVRSVAALKPGIACPEMLRHAEPQAVFLRRLLPISHHVAVRAHVHRIPTVIPRIPEMEIVVMRAHADEILRSRFLVQGHQPIGIPFLGLPERNDVFIAEHRRMPVMGEMIFVVVAPLFVHLPRIPIPFHRHGLRAPMRPDAEFRVAKPFGIAILLERLHRRLEGPRGDGKFLPVLGPRAGRDGQGNQGNAQTNRMTHGSRPRCLVMRKNSAWNDPP